MGKGTDKLYITHSEWSSEDAFSTSAGANARQSSNTGASFKRLPFNFCALSLLPFEHPVCTKDGAIFDLTNILPWIKKHGTNPVNGDPLKSSDLIKLHFVKNDDDEYVDPVTFKVLTDNTRIVAVRNTGNVFSWDTVNRLNIKTKNWKDLVNEVEFERSDIVTLQDPQNVASRDLSQFKYLKDGENVLTAEQEAQRSADINVKGLGSAAKILKAKGAVARARAEREKAMDHAQNGVEAQALTNPRKAHAESIKSSRTTKSLPYNAAQHTNGQAAASFTSTGLTPNTSTERAILSDEEYMLKPRRIKIKGYARLGTNFGELNVELCPEFAPKAVRNFVQLSKRGYYKGVPFHRNIKNFMLQGGDPTGTGRGGRSCWDKPFADEFEGPLTHDARGVLSMANKGKDTNTSQFFITYRAVPHLNRKHTIFGRVIDGLEVLKRLEAVDVDDKDRPTELCEIDDIVVYVDPFEEFLKQRSDKEAAEARREEIKREGGAEDDRTTWTGKRIRSDGKLESGAEEVGIGKYMRQNQPQQGEEEIIEDWDEPAHPTKKIKSSGGFGNFDNW